MILTSIPYITGYAGKQMYGNSLGLFLGLRTEFIYRQDVERRLWGNGCLKTPYTSSIQRGVVAFLPYLALGQARLWPCLFTSSF